MGGRVLEALRDRARLGLPRDVPIAELARELELSPAIVATKATQLRKRMLIAAATGDGVIALSKLDYARLVPGPVPGDGAAPAAAPPARAPATETIRATRRA